MTPRDATPADPVEVADASGASGEDEPHPTSRLDDVVHQKARLGILALLSEADRADFTYLRSNLGLTDGNLGRHIEVLAGSGLVHVEKGYAGRRPRTWVTITRAGRHALAEEMAAIRELLRRFEGG
ncbi:winged helix-turn-helix domain-containing protein [Intrasporangium flavum]|uniref:winged helix-turn-helix domain-containing protein n=1 Tax=Intrasporangium flavum TaxID=1428657 RepID=UPI001F601294|nr:transcriptional regulator [Intrasporangium flavum]